MKTHLEGLASTSAPLAAFAAVKGKLLVPWHLSRYLFLHLAKRSRSLWDTKHSAASEEKSCGP